MYVHILLHDLPNLILVLDYRMSSLGITIAPYQTVPTPSAQSTALPTVRTVELRHGATSCAPGAQGAREAGAIPRWEQDGAITQSVL